MTEDVTPDRHGLEDKQWRAIEYGRRAHADGRVDITVSAYDADGVLVSRTHGVNNEHLDDRIAVVMMLDMVHAVCAKAGLGNTPVSLGFPDVADADQKVIVDRDALLMVRPSGKAYWLDGRAQPDVAELDVEGLASLAALFEQARQRRVDGTTPIEVGDGNDELREVLWALRESAADLDRLRNAVELLIESNQDGFLPHPPLGTDERVIAMDYLEAAEDSLAGFMRLLASVQGRAALAELVTGLQ